MVSHTDMVTKLDSHFLKRVWQVGPIVGVVLARLMKDITGITGRTGLTEIAGMLGSEVLLVTGWILGQILTELDHVFYAGMCNPQELTCQRVKKEIEAKNWGNAWRILQETKNEREKMPIRNMLTVAVILGLGIWVISSNTNFLAMGVILGMTYRLFAEILTETNFRKWYWLFARDFKEVEHKGFIITWIAVLIWETIKVILV